MFDFIWDYIFDHSIFNKMLIKNFTKVLLLFKIYVRVSNIFIQMMSVMQNYWTLRSILWLSRAFMVVHKLWMDWTWICWYSILNWRVQLDLLNEHIWYLHFRIEEVSQRVAKSWLIIVWLKKSKTKKNVRSCF